MCSTRSTASLLDAVMGLLWAQWTELGVAGLRGTQASVIDPEALVVATAQFGRYDARLFDEVLDWLASYSDALDVTRLRRLAVRRDGVDARVLGALLDFMRRESATAKWDASAQQMVAREDVAGYGSATPLFLNTPGEAFPAFGQVDELFLEHGINKSRTVLRGMSVPPAPRRPALARLRLRALVGGGVRAEVMLYLATHECAHGRLIAARSGFSQRQVSEYLTQLADVGFAERWEEGRRVQYRLDESLRAACGPMSTYVDWPKAWKLASVLWATTGSASQAATPYAGAKEWRIGLDAVKELLPIEGLKLRPPVPDDHRGELILEHADEYVGWVAAAFRTLAQEPTS